MAVAKKSTASKLVVPKRWIGPPGEEQGKERFPGIEIPVTRENLTKDLQRLKQMALDMGAEDAAIIRAKQIPRDIRARYQCFFPRCRWLDQCIYCPTKARLATWEEAESVVTSYDYAIAYKFPAPPDDVVKKAAADIGVIKLDKFYIAGGGPRPDPMNMLRNVVRQRILIEVARKIEQAGFYSGYMWAMSLGVGSCLVTWCSDTGTCQALERGATGFCKVINVRPPGNSEFFIDYHGLGRALGWGELQSGGNCAMPEETDNPSAYFNIGITLVA